MLIMRVPAALRQGLLAGLSSCFVFLSSTLLRGFLGGWRMKKNQGFTLIEALIVVSVLGVLAGVSVGVINYSEQKKHAENAVKMANLDKTTSAIEAYRLLEKFYPVDTNDDGNPLNDNPGLAKYLDLWPTGAVYEKSGSQFLVYVPKSTTSGLYKYDSSWGSIKECGLKDVGVSGACSGVDELPPVTLASIGVSPASKIVYLPSQASYTAMGTYSDGSTKDITAEAAWAAVKTTVATSLGGGLFNAVAAGSTGVTAQLNEINGSSNLYVKKVTSVSVAPSSRSIPVGGTASYTAIAFCSDGSSIGVTNTAVWGVNPPLGVASSLGQGKFGGLMAGSTTVKATFGGKTGTASLTVTSGPEE